MEKGGRTTILITISREANQEALKKKKKKKKWILAKFLQNLGCGAADHSVEGCR